MSVSDMDYREASDHSLLRWYRRKRDQQAFAELVSRHHGLVMGLSRRLLGCPHLAEDAVQATFLVLARDAQRIRRGEALASWLYCVAFRISSRLQRRRARNSLSEFQDDVMVADDPLEKLCAQFEQQTAFEELHRLPESMRAAMVLRYLQGKSNAEVATELSLSESAVEGRLKRGRDQLRLRLARQGVAFVTVIAVMESMRQEVQAGGHVEQVAQVAQNCFAEAELGRSAAMPSKLAEEEVWKMTTTTIGKQLVALTCTTAALAMGWSLLGRVDARAAGNGEEVVLPSRAITSGQPSIRIAQTAQVNQPARGVGTPSTGAATNTAAETAPAKNRYYYYATGNAGNNAKQATSPSTFSMEEYSPLEMRIKRALSQTAEFEFHDEPLVAVLEQLKEQYNIPIVLDRVGLEDVGIDGTSEPITGTYAEVRLQSALNRMLDPLHLTVVLKDEMLMVTTAERACEICEPRVYRAKAEWSLSVEELIDVITSTVEPNSWSDVGGPGSIVGIQGALVIRNSDRVHDQINLLLRQIDKVRR